MYSVFVGTRYVRVGERADHYPLLSVKVGDFSCCGVTLLDAGSVCCVLALGSRSHPVSYSVEMLTEL